MLDFIFHSVAAQIGLAGVAIIALVAVAYFFPPFRRMAIGAAGLILAAATIYAKGARDEKRAWNKATEKDIAKGKDARSRAERDVASGRVRGSEWDRDSGSM